MMDDDDDEMGEKMEWDGMGWDGMGWDEGNERCIRRRQR